MLTAVVQRFIIYRCGSCSSFAFISGYFTFWRRIEAVITGRTRNALALRGTRVRIPPSPLFSVSTFAGSFLFTNNRFDKNCPSEAMLPRSNFLFYSFILYNQILILFRTNDSQRRSGFLPYMYLRWKAYLLFPHLLCSRCLLTEVLPL